MDLAVDSGRRHFNLLWKLNNECVLVIVLEIEYVRTKE